MQKIYIVVRHDFDAEKSPWDIPSDWPVCACTSKQTAENEIRKYEEKDCTDENGYWPDMYTPYCYKIVELELI